MLRLGICTQDEYLRVGDRRRFSGARVAYNLLDVGDAPTEEQIQVFEDVSFTLRTSNGTFRTTFRQRFREVDELSLRWIERFYPRDTQVRVQDRAVSHGLTSWEWAQRLFQAFPRADFEASDVLLYLIEVTLADGGVYILEPNGTPLQYIKPPFVLSLHHPESWRYPINRAIAARASRKFQRLGLSARLPKSPPDCWLQQEIQSPDPGRYRVRKIPFIHPEARAFLKSNSRFQFRFRSVFEHTPEACDVLRTMNIFNQAYFPAEQLEAGARAVFHSLKPGGIWIVGRTLDDLSNHVTFFRRQASRWEVLDRVGEGSEMEQVALRFAVQSSDLTARP